MPTFAEIATNDPESRFDILLAAAGFVDSSLPGTNLVATLSDPTQSLTVFAPTDAAFVQLAVDQGFAGDTTDEGAVTTFLTGLGPELLRDTILYHVSAGPQTAADIAGSGTVTSLLGPTITADLPTLVDQEPDVIDPTLIATDIMATNGVLHVIDRVLLPLDLAGNDAPSIAGIVAASGSGFDTNNADFDILLQAVTTANLVGALSDPTADLTAFAPTDAAFIGLAQALGFSGSDESGAWSYLVDALTLLGGGDPIPLLTEILTYHVAGESLQASQVLASAGITTLQGGVLTLDGTSIVDADPDVPNPNLIQTDIQAENGIVHVIDGVLLPADVLASDGSNDVDFILAGDSFDFISTGADNDLVDGNGGSDWISLGSGNDVGFGGSGADAVLGGSGNDNIRGDGGFDFLDGGSGMDTASGGDGNDFVLGGADADSLSGDNGHDYVDGGSGNDEVFGGAGDDFVMGGHGDDLIFGGEGSNILQGGGGEDVFVIDPGAEHDVITDFRGGEDFIILSGFADFDAISDQIVDLGFIGTEINTGADSSLILLGVDASEVSADLFLF